MNYIPVSLLKLIAQTMGRQEPLMEKDFLQRENEKVRMAITAKDLPHRPSPTK